MVNFLNIRKNYLVFNWFIIDSIIYFFNKILGVGLNNIRVVSGLEIEISVNSKNVYPFILFLNKHSLCRFKNMMDVICYDTIGKAYRFGLVYNLLSIQNNLRIRIITKVNESSQLLSLVSLYRSIGWSEREIFDFFGLFFF
jgi:NADH:ubiquinone oxidoreductase subunit C